MTSELFEKGKRAFEKQNYDYAMDLFGEVVQNQPDNRQARKLLRESEVRKARQEGFPHPVLAKIRGFIPWMKSKLYSDPDDVIQACEQYLKIDPEDVPTRIKLSEALREKGLLDSAIVELRQLAESNNDLLEVHEQLAVLYEAAGDSDRSTKHLQRVKELDPGNRDIEERIKNTMAETTVERGGWDGAESTQDLIRDKQEADELERESRILTEPDEIKEAIADLKSELQEQDLMEDEQFEKWKRIGELYQKIDEFDSAISALEKASEIRPQDGQLTMKIGDLRLRKWEERIQTVKQKLEEKPDDQELQQKLKTLKKKQLKQRLNEYKKRVENHPTDMELRFHYGRYLRQAGKTEEAISQLQQAVKDPNVKAKAYVHLGRSFLDNDHPDMAIDQFKKGLEDARSTEEEVDLKYDLARAYMEDEKWEEAVQNFREILEEDYSYKNASELFEEAKEKAEK